MSVFRWGSRDPERGSHLPGVTQEASSSGFYKILKGYSKETLRGDRKSLGRGLSGKALETKRTRKLFLRLTPDLLPMQRRMGWQWGIGETPFKGLAQ